MVMPDRPNFLVQEAEVEDLEGFEAAVEAQTEEAVEAVEATEVEDLEGFEAVVEAQTEEVVEVLAAAAVLLVNEAK